MVQSDYKVIVFFKCYKCDSALYEVKDGKIKCPKCNRIRGKILR